MSQRRTRVSSLSAGDLIRVKIYRDRIGQRGGLPTYSQATIRLGDGRFLAGYWKANHTHMVGRHRFVIDADCPNCRYPERWFDQQTRRFGCNHCTYTSKERDG